MLKFANPECLWFLLALPLLGVLFVGLHYWGKNRIHRFVSESMLNLLSPELSYGKRAWKKSFLLGACACLILAAADPQVGTRLEDVKREGIDLFVALDVSLSMKTEDVKPSRLEKAKRDISSLLQKLSGDRVGLIVFAGDAFVQFPLTADYSAADLFLSAVDVDAVPVPGTMIASAIELGLKSFETDLPTQKAIVVVTDGENTEGDVLGAIEDAKKAHVRVYTVGTGTPEGSPIPIYSAQGQRVDYKHDASGNIVLSKLDESMLQQIAAATGGSYRRATSGGNEIDDIYKELESIGKTEFGVKQISGYESRYQYPLALAILLLMVEVMLSERTGKLMLIIKKLIPASALFLLTLTGSSVLEAQTVRSSVQEGNRGYEKGKYNDAEVSYKKALVKDPKSHAAQFNLGDALYKQQRYDEAMREFNNAAVVSGGPAGKAASYYNLGNSFFQSNKLQESIQAYKQALKVDPNDEDARYNLQLALDRLKQQQQNKDKQKKQQDQQQQNPQKNRDQQQKQNQNQQQQQQPQNQQAKSDQTRQQQLKNQMPKEEADRILDALRNTEKQIQKELRKRTAAKVHVEKDW